MEFVFSLGGLDLRAEFGEQTQIKELAAALLEQNHAAFARADQEAVQLEKAVLTIVTSVQLNPYRTVDECIREGQLLPGLPISVAIFRPPATKEHLFERPLAFVDSVPIFPEFEILVQGLNFQMGTEGNLTVKGGLFQVEILGKREVVVDEAFIRASTIPLKIITRNRMMNLRFLPIAAKESRTPQPRSPEHSAAEILTDVFQPEKFTVANPGTLTDKERFPIALILAPVFMGIVMAVQNPNATTLSFMIISPLISTLTFWLNRRHLNKKHRSIIVGAAAEFNRLQEYVNLSQAGQAQAARRNHPRLSELAGDLPTRGPLLWARKENSLNYANLLLGRAEIPSLCKVDTSNLSAQLQTLHTQIAAKAEVTSAQKPGHRHQLLKPFTRRAALKGANDELFEYLQKIVDLARESEVMPEGDLIFDLLNCRNLGITGSKALQFCNYLLLSLMLSGPPSALAVRFLGDTRKMEVFKWSPHLSQPVAVNDLVPSPELLTSQRFLLVVMNPSVEQKNQILREFEELDEKSDRLMVVWLERNVDDLPTIIQTYACVNQGQGVSASLVDLKASKVTQFEPHAVLTYAQTERVLRPMACLIDKSKRDNALKLVPQIARLEIVPSPETVVANWQRTLNNFPQVLSAGVGLTGNSVAEINLRRDGPHALVGGTTGSGKSEFLQTWIMQLAANNSPELVNFLLVDYKGGTAFRECAWLPHTVGLVTDLSGSLMNRVLLSLSAEIRRREEILNKYEVKDLPGFEALRRTQSDKRIEPVPSLLIIIDEFAALVNDQPGFIDAVIDIAQRGRSLGLHLIMATQRPSGVVKDNLRANTNLRIALRVADENESVDIVGEKTAAEFANDVPGRVIMKSGNQDSQIFQSYFLGASANGSAAKVKISEFTL